MSWQLLVCLSVILYSVNGLLHRTIMKDESSDSYAQAVLFTGLTGVFSFTFLLFKGGFQSHLTFNILPLFLLAAFASAMGMICTFKGFKLVDASEHTILLTSSQLWGLLGAIFFLKETLTITKLIGIIAILFGVTFAEWKKKKLVLNKGAFYVLLAAFFFAGSGTISYFIVRSFDVLSFMVYGSVMVTTILVILRPKVIKKLSFYFKPKNALNILFTSVNDTLANIFGFLAYQSGGNALQIGPISATQSLLTVLLAIIILKEKKNVINKVIGSISAVAGTILLLQ
ncbi:DMT family transporter [Patescibacteria group bacterium]